MINSRQFTNLQREAILDLLADWERYKRENQGDWWKEEFIESFIESR